MTGQTGQIVSHLEQQDRAANAAVRHPARCPTNRATIPEECIPIPLRPRIERFWGEAIRNPSANFFGFLGRKRSAESGRRWDGSVAVFGSSDRQNATF
jgi:hypothetical protein